MTLIGIYNLDNIEPMGLWQLFLEQKGFPREIAQKIVGKRSVYETGYVTINMDNAEVKYFPEYPTVSTEVFRHMYLLHEFTEWSELTARMRLMGKYVLRDLGGVYMSGNSMEVRDHAGTVRIKVGGQ